jgi:hypothetical protein
MIGTTNASNLLEGLLLNIWMKDHYQEKTAEGGTGLIIVLRFSTHPAEDSLSQYHLVYALGSNSDE